jgi:predicted site-specific integrase-resolvase
MPAKDTREMMSALEVCELLGINLNNLRQITHRGRIKPIKKKVGKYKQYVKADVLLYHAKRELRGMPTKKS